MVCHDCFRILAIIFCWLHVSIAFQSGLFINKNRRKTRLRDSSNFDNHYENEESFIKTTSKNWPDPSQKYKEALLELLVLTHEMQPEL